MFVLVIGLVMVIVGALCFGFPELCRSLKKNDPGGWQKLGSPNGTIFSGWGNSLVVHSWILNFESEKSPNQEIKELGRRAVKKALFAKYSML